MILELDKLKKRLLPAAALTVLVMAPLRHGSRYLLISSTNTSASVTTLPRD